MRQVEGPTAKASGAGGRRRWRPTAAFLRGTPNEARHSRAALVTANRFPRTWARTRHLLDASHNCPTAANRARCSRRRRAQQTDAYEALCPEKSTLADLGIRRERAVERIGRQTTSSISWPLASAWGGGQDQDVFGVDSAFGARRRDRLKMIAAAIAASREPAAESARRTLSESPTPNRGPARALHGSWRWLPAVPRYRARHGSAAEHGEASHHYRKAKPRIGCKSSDRGRGRNRGGVRRRRTHPKNGSLVDAVHRRLGSSTYGGDAHMNSSRRSSNTSGRISSARSRGSRPSSTLRRLSGDPAARKGSSRGLEHLSNAAPRLSANER